MQAIGKLTVFNKDYRVLVRQTNTNRYYKLAAGKIGKSMFFDEADGLHFEENPVLFAKFLKGEVVKI